MVMCNKYLEKVFKDYHMCVCVNKILKWWTQNYFLNVTCKSYFESLVDAIGHLIGS